MPLPRLTRRAAGGTDVVGYRVLHQVGAGGFSTVYAAEEIGRERQTALKIARDRSRQTRDRFDFEAEIGQRLVAARGVVGVLEQTRTTDGVPVLVMPFYDRGTAAELLAAEAAKSEVPKCRQALCELGTARN